MVEATGGWEACQQGLQYLGEEWPDLRPLLLDARGFQVAARPLCRDRRSRQLPVGQR
jgi:hypothetical protein